MCAQRIDGIPYPDSWGELKKDATLLKVFRVHCKKEFIEENYLFLTRGTAVPNRDYVMYIHDKAANCVNIAGQLKAKMDKLVADSPKDANNRPVVNWQDPAWSKHLRDAEAELTRLINSDHLMAGGRFWKSDTFATYHKKLSAAASSKSKNLTAEDLVPKAEKVQKLPWKTLQFLGWEDAKDQLLQKALIRMVEAVKKGNVQAAKGAHKDAILLQSRKSLVRTQKFEDTVKEFRKKGLLPKK